MVGGFAPPIYGRRVRRAVTLVAQGKCIALQALDFIVLTPGLSPGKPSSMRTGRLNASRRFQRRPLTQFSPGGLTGPMTVSVLILGRSSHLDAFSGSCCRP